MELTNQLKKYIRSLNQVKYRQKYDKFTVEGPKVCAEFLSANYFKINYILALDDWVQTQDSVFLKQRCDNLITIKQKELQSLSNLKQANQVIIVCEKAAPRALIDISEGWKLYLDEIKDPGNMGTIIRIADWYGIKEVYLSEDAVDPYNPKVIQAAMGSHNRVEMARILTTQLVEIKLPKYGLTLAGKPIGEDTSLEPGLIVIGNESRGIRKELISQLDIELCIPRKGGAESLNAAVATGIACQLLT